MRFHQKRESGSANANKNAEGYPAALDERIRGNLQVLNAMYERIMKCL